MIFPKKLEKGDTIGIISPSSPYKPKSKDSLYEELDEVKKLLKVLDMK
ncbi:hypothetical protein H477_5640 [[Clostridium] sordellii ATCC 9714]|nr:hypothetical protein H477_5640 [[Clostridium] sordellii ATCC 9714] [Paeniclostridium sordellii ATCC 9714]